MNPAFPRPPLPVGLAPITVTYQEDVGPLFARSCAVSACHTEGDLAGGLRLDRAPTVGFEAGYEALLASGAGSGGGRVYVDALGTSARQSQLVERLLGRELDAPAVMTRACPGTPPLDPEELTTVVRWIESGAVYRRPAP